MSYNNPESNANGLIGKSPKPKMTVEDYKAQTEANNFGRKEAMSGQAEYNKSSKDVVSTKY